MLFQVVVQPGTSYVDTFRYGNNEVLQQIWTERIEPYIDTYPRVRNCKNICRKKIALISHGAQIT